MFTNLYLVESPRPVLKGLKLGFSFYADCMLDASLNKWNECVRFSKLLNGGGVPNRQTEHYTGSQGKSFKEQTNDLGIRIVPISKINPQRERNQYLKICS